MNTYQTINLAYEYLSLLNEIGMSREEAMEEIKLVLETEYRREILSEVDADLCYEYKHVLSDILNDIQATAERFMSLQLN
jgi:hypothetical protein